MDDLLEQFLLESRELVAQAVDDLLVLERTPEDRGRIDQAFRAFHTLKGAAGIIDFSAMASALHAAEDTLAEVRSGGELTAETVESCLFCLDQVGRWLDTIESTGVPPASAAAEASAVTARFRSVAAGESVERDADVTPGGSWLSDFLQSQGEHRSRAVTAIRYRPDSDCFFRGEDPLAIVMTLPGVLAVDLALLAPVADLAAFNPVHCDIEISILSSATMDTVRGAFAGISGIVLVAPAALSALAASARSMLEAQMAVLADTSHEGLAGRIRSAGAVAGNILGRVGRLPDRAVIDEAMALSLASASPAALLDALRAVLGNAIPVEPAAVAPTPEPTAGTTRSLRVDVERIEALVTIAGELIVLKNAIGYSADLAELDPAAAVARLKDQHVALDRLTSALREAVLGARVVPFRTLFQRFPRVVRDLGISLGKNIALSMEGEEAEADKAVVEALFEPLLHLVRNAADHGIESKETRLGRGKRPTGTIHLRATREGDQVVVEVRDDGGGMDAPRIRQLAIERGIAGSETLSAMGDEEVIDVIFAPGFSTAVDITDVSGRGVGMDAVRAAVERLGGRVSVRTASLVGSTVTLRLPLTVMVTRLMTIEVGGQTFGLPLDAVLETALVPRERIKPVGSARAFVLRDRTVPLINLRAALGQDAGTDASATARVVVVSFAGMIGAIEVDRLGDRLDAIVKPIGGLLSSASGISGTTLLGDGRVLIVLDVEEILS